MTNNYDFATIFSLSSSPTPPQSPACAPPTSPITTSSSTQTLPLTSSTHRPARLQIGHLSSSGMAGVPTDISALTNRPSHPQVDSHPSVNRPLHIQRGSTPSSIRLPHPQADCRIMSPHGHLIPISPRKLHGMRTRQHFKEEYSYIIDAKEKGNIGRYINVSYKQIVSSGNYGIVPSTTRTLHTHTHTHTHAHAHTHSTAAHQTCLFRMSLLTHMT